MRSSRTPWRGAAELNVHPSIAPAFHLSLILFERLSWPVQGVNVMRTNRKVQVQEEHEDQNGWGRGMMRRRH